MDRSAFNHRTARSAVSAGSNWILGYKISEILWSIEDRRNSQKLAVEAENERSVGPTQPD
jgi:hypothetical protein